MFIYKLPKDAFLQILNKVSARDLSQIANVSKSMKEISEDDRLWIEKFRAHFNNSRYRNFKSMSRY